MNSNSAELREIPQMTTSSPSLMWQNNSTAENGQPIRNAEVASVNPFTSTIGPPPLPPRPDLTMTQSYGMGGMGSYGMGGMGSYGMGGMGSYGMGGMGTYGMGGMGSYGMAGMGSYGMGGMGSYGMGGLGGYGYNSMGHQAYGDIENRFIQIAEENSRPTFDSIQSIVHAVGSVAMMLENTFFALTSSFRAILGVAENMGRLRSLFAQIWSTFAVLRSINWLIRKLLVLLGIRSEEELKAWAEATASTQTNGQLPEQARRSGWPAVLFFGVVAAAPYIVLRMFNGLSNRTSELLNDPKTWKDALRGVSQHDFHATSPQELSFRANQVLTIAPKQLQGPLWNSGWLMASADNQTAGLVPVPYIKMYPDSQNRPESGQTQPQ